ncbi:unnamed protein product [Prunus armeniaca]|uniref:Uncharacterized protein n=1 Tax=Prunus armeniaca TaxID=36596 RepID=A0A6J5TZZ2_PRUAR|nr:unnamed protein product [Prunus armeniaca]
MVVRDEKGQFVAAAVVHIPQALVVGDTEAYAAREATLVKDHSGFSFMFTRHQANEVAHRLARCALSCKSTIE